MNKAKLSLLIIGCLLNYTVDAKSGSLTTNTSGSKSPVSSRTTGSLEITTTPAPPSPESPSTSQSSTPSSQETLRLQCSNNLTVCKGKPDNSKAYINNTCSQYAVCISGCALSFKCPYDLLFDLKSSQCDYARNVKCPWKSLSPSGPKTGPSGIACEQCGKCKDQPDGTLLPASNDPNSYIVCQCQCEVKRPCPAGLVFNCKLLTCDFPEKL